MNTRTQLTESNEAHRKLGEEVVALRDRCERLRLALVRSSNGYCRCGVCGCEWHDGDPEVHDADCIAAPAKPASRPRASSSAQKPRVAASKRRR